ncbi:phosphoribosylformylglycinamidine synthase subunit PurQ [Weissella viridescens]|jgi:phosphoribosylformylglycinamidine synthase|uniref:Phosphoribosylformylglycinamidine synthase subunit PurQ n=1 Tax=Weissella viridescens TaxID=1629 RepID=A0A0R2H1W3_WEIVI|nr:phosphoribosylformylglycinamidine synthase subunit PurQ [Weissella viridescens]KRN46831.1 phosphoribosylformylglycinamidine synthase I [Weissella viridescens]MBX4172445.1 phosphoribosylformylglycinamidine synthase subunit PurQ [Weissella viridescens]WJI91890.1 phosphoribosylformylglycinamidine synthase subunit PurQ [Weissella viridescens]SUP58856.1 Phosphoribosylformylglycinamidine synthase 1 [Weissella viridescens]GEA94172.1 phosphoribosylformylglycinamidine synthase subunit PurQ [Weissell
MKSVVVRFPGSNCDEDMFYALQELGLNPSFVSAQSDISLADYDAIFLPGGFSYGDYLRTGAIARFSPIMQAVQAAADNGQLVVGICNGFQILTESGLLPGQLMMNEVPGFICDETLLQVEQAESAFTNAYTTDEILIPVAHADGRYYADEQTLADLESNHQIVFKYTSNLNGSEDMIAGITNKQGNVLGMMPHPERAVDPLIGNTDGQNFFKSILATVATQGVN